jgi:hypothetical protein
MPVARGVDRPRDGRPERKTSVLSERERSSSPTTRAGTPWSATRCRTPTRCTRSRSSRAAARWLHRLAARRTSSSSPGRR